tara:strand:+ start:7973 stop:9400 length:1428 start_codon:yes stop_codon:yes gene_type:complete
MIMAYKIGIVGGGLSGSLLAIQLLRRLPETDEVIVFEPRSVCGRGLAYGTNCASHILNVPAGKISIFPDRRDDFIEWLATSDDPEIRRYATAASFVPRQIFGDYVCSRLDQSIKQRFRPESFAHVRDTVNSAYPAEGGQKLHIRTERDQIFEVDHLVLAMGNSLASQTRYGFLHPWNTERTEGTSMRGPILVLGSGLTAVDTLLRLRETGYEGQVVFLSRRGLLPRPHDLTEPENHPAFTPTDAGTQPLSTLLAKVRNNARQFGWRTTIDGLRPMSQAIWQTLDDTKRRRFIRHLQTWWDVHRHRMSRETAQIIDAEMASGNLKIIKGRISKAQKKPGQSWEISIRGHGQETSEDFCFPVAYDCTGPRADLETIDVPLIWFLNNMGHIRPDPLGLGIDVDDTCQAIRSNGRSSKFLSVIGPLTRGKFWEITAAAEIRNQAATLAEDLSNKASSRYERTSLISADLPATITGREIL